MGIDREPYRKSWYDADEYRIDCYCSLFSLEIQWKNWKKEWQDRLIYDEIFFEDTYRKRLPKADGTICVFSTKS